MPNLPVPSDEVVMLGGMGGMRGHAFVKVSGDHCNYHADDAVKVAA